MISASRLIALLLCLGIAGCTGQKSDVQQTTNDDTMKREWPMVPSDSVRIITLPTPMQIPALLRNTRANYNRDILLSIDQNEKSFFKSNLLFGTYMIDMAYAGSFGDQQTALAYFDRCKNLGDDMGLGMTLDTRFTERFLENLSRPDSLGENILELYDKGHFYFKENGKEGVGLLMIMGCLFEGLHLGFAQARDHDLILFLHILSQQKQYTENLIYALDGFEIPSEVQYEYEQLVKLDQLFMKLNPPSAYELKTGKVLATEINESILVEIETIVDGFRESISV